MIMTEVIVRKINMDTKEELARRVIHYCNQYELDGLNGQLVIDFSDGLMVGNRLEHSHLTWKETKN